jgi:hypothetical protein
VQNGAVAKQVGCVGPFVLFFTVDVNFLVTFNSSRRIGYATVVNLTLVAQSIAALVCEGFVIARKLPNIPPILENIQKIMRKYLFTEKRHTGMENILL